MRRGDHRSAENRTENEFVNVAVEVVKQLLPFVVIFFLGYWGYSLIWPCAILLVMVYSSYRSDQKRERLFVKRAMALGREKEIILNSLRELPFWIRFQDVEQAEWLNKFFRHLWLQVNKYAHTLIPQILEPAIQNYVSDFKFEQVVLGNVPLRVDGVKIYDQDDRRKIVMDLDISYAGDCYVTFQTYTFTGGIKDIQIYGRLRVVLTPLINKMPLIGGIQAYFTNPPRVDFDLIKITQILDIPGIRNKIMSTTMKTINSLLLYPNAYSINLNQNVNMSRHTVFTTEGILRVHVVEAKNLINKDIIGKSDPYVVLKVGSIRVETPVIQNTLNPKWDFWHEFEIETNSEIKIEVWDRDDGTKDDALGRARIGIAHVVKIGASDMWIPLQGVAKGSVHLRLGWLSLSSDYGDLAAAVKEAELLSPQLHTCLLMIYLDSSLNLAMISKTPPNPYLELEVEGVVKKSDVEVATCAPAWDKGFTFLIRDPTKAVLDIRVVDDDSGKSLGEISFKVDNLKDDPRLELRRHTFFFSAPYAEASICCSMKLRILKNEYVEEKVEGETKPRKVLSKQESSFSNKSNKSITSQSSAVTSNGSFISDISDDDEESLGTVKLSLSYSKQRQRLLVQVHEMQIRKPADCYVKLYLQMDNNRTNKKKTKVIKHCSTPTFDEHFDYLISGQDLTFTYLVVVAECEKGFLDLRKKFLGQTMIALTKCDNLTDPFTDTFHLKSKKDTDVYHLIRE